MDHKLILLKEQAQRLDADDRLKSFKSLFMSADPEELYMDGNSLGRLPISTREALSKGDRNPMGKSINPLMERMLV